MTASGGMDWDLIIPCVTIEVGEAGERGPAGPSGGAQTPFVYQMPTPNTTVTVTHGLGRDPVSAQVTVNGIPCVFYALDYPAPSLTARLTFDVPARALIRLF